MFDSEIRLRINYDVNPESKEAEDLAKAIFVLQDVRFAFEKAGTYCETEIEQLKAAEDILSRVGRGDTF